MATSNANIRYVLTSNKKIAANGIIKLILIFLLFVTLAIYQTITIIKNAEDAVLCENSSFIDGLANLNMRNSTSHIYTDSLTISRCLNTVVPKLSIYFLKYKSIKNHNGR